MLYIIFGQLLKNRKERKDVKNCQVCLKEFNILQYVQNTEKEYINAKIVQDSYVLTAVLINQLYFKQNKIFNHETYQDKHRFCNPCYKNQQFIYQIIKDQDLTWNKDSKISKQWLQSVNQDYKFQENLQIYNQNLQYFQDDNQIIDKDVLQVKQKYYQKLLKIIKYFREELTIKFLINNIVNLFIQFNRNLQKINKNQNLKNQIKIIMQNNLEKILKMFQVLQLLNQGYCQGMNIVVCFLLCFSSVETAFNLYCYLIENVLPKNFLLKTSTGVQLIGLQANIHLIEKLITKRLKDQYSQLNLDRILQFSQIKLPQLLIKLMVNDLDIQSNLIIWDQIIKNKSFDMLINAILAIICQECLIVLQDNSYKSSESVYELMKLRINVNNIQVYNQNNPIDIEYNNQIIEQYFQNYSNKWIQQDSLTIHQLKKFSNFDQQEIQMFQITYKLFIDQKEDKKGMNKNEFRQFMQKMQLSEDIQNKMIIQINEIDNIFDLFDDNQSAYLDFRQFLCGISLLMRGTIRDKLKTLFYIFDKNKQDFIDRLQFQKLIDNLVQSFVKVIDIQNLQEFQENSIKFKERILLNTQKEFKLIDVIQIENDQFCQALDQCIIDNNYKAQLKRQTVKLITQNLNS